MARALAGENAQARALTGQGRPGLNTLLGGTSPESGADGYSTFGGGAQTSSGARLAKAHRDVRLQAVYAASAGGPSSGGGGPRGPGPSGDNDARRRRQDP